MFDELPGQTVYGKEIGEADALPSSYAKPGESDSWHVQSELPAGLYPQKTPRSSDNLVDGISSAQTLKMTGTDDLPTDNARVFANMMEHETGSSVKVQPGEYGQENNPLVENNSNTQGSAIGKEQKNIKVSHLEFSGTTKKHMDNPKRAVPVEILKEAIASGSPAYDPDGSNATMYYTTMYRNGKKYNLEVLYDSETGMILHFQYTPKAIGNLPKIGKE